MSTSQNKTVSVIIPCYNEEATIRLLLNALVQQTYPIESVELVIADGMSDDLTREVINDFHVLHPQLTLQIVDNHKRIIPSGLNQAIEASQGEYIVRLDGHSVAAPDYIERCVEALKQGLGDNVGGIWNIQPAPLRDRGEDIALLAGYFLESFAVKYQKPKVPWAADFSAALQAHHWPGNVRELRNAMERLTVLATGTNLTAADFKQFCLSTLVEEASDLAPMSLAEAERQAIERALAATAGNKTHAAQLLGITPKTLNAKLALYSQE